MKLRLNSWSTKFSKDVTCCCSTDTKITIEHIIFHCPYMNNLYQENDINIDNNRNLVDVLGSEIVFKIAKTLIKSNLGKIF